MPDAHSEDWADHFDSAHDSGTPPVLKGISDIRRYFFRNQTPTYFISATNFNLLGMDEWVRNFHFINYIDCFDGEHPHVFVPSEKPHQEFTCIEDINNYLLEHKEVVDFIGARGPGGKAVFLFFDEDTEALCRELGLEVCFPSAELRREVDDKISATRIADRAGVPSVPNILTRVDSYEHLREVSSDLGRSWSSRRPSGTRGTPPSSSPTRTTGTVTPTRSWTRARSRS
jgi:hypothetical protein